MDSKLELYDNSRSILSMEGDVSELSDHEARVSKAIFNVCLKIRRLLHMPVPVDHRDGIKLPKIDVPTFDGGHHELANVLGAVRGFHPLKDSAN